MSASGKSIKYALFLIMSLAVGCSEHPKEKPALVVYVVVDQLRGDLLERYDSLFTGGFRRLHDDGFRFLSATHDHAKTATAVGHTVLSTGAFPSRNGIVANDWMERTPQGWTSVYCVEDTMTHVLGLPALEGRSPKNLLRGGLADWIVSADSGAVIVSASRKDRAAITMSGQTNGHTYWIDSNTAQFVTSTFYADDYPGWVDRINQVEMPILFGDSVWEQTMPAVARNASRPDTSGYEGDGTHTFFPHRFMDEVRDPSRHGALNRWGYTLTPPDAALGIFAADAVRVLNLGDDAITDYLALSFSQTDDIGHDFGPLSREQLENFLHLDRTLGKLMRVLDDEVGENRWVMAVTGDHGVMGMPEYLAEEGVEARRATREELAELRRIFEEHREMDGEAEDVTNSLISSLEQLPYVADALTVLELTTPPAVDSFTVLMKNSYHPDRWIGGSGSQGSGVVFRYVDGFYPSSSPQGTGHGSPYYHDRFVPLIFLGTGVGSGFSTEPVKSVDIAPTLASLAGIATPDDLDGRPLLK
jgi:hypothetical protein